jgi:hypothetical protein
MNECCHLGNVYKNKSLFVQTTQEQIFAIVHYNLEVGQNWFQCPMGGKLYRMTKEPRNDNFFLP